MFVLIYVLYPLLCPYLSYVMRYFLAIYEKKELPIALFVNIYFRFVIQCTEPSFTTTYILEKLICIFLLLSLQINFFLISVENIEHVVFPVWRHDIEKDLYTYMYVYLLIHLDSFDDVEQRKLPRGIVDVNTVF